MGVIATNTAAIQLANAREKPRYIISTKGSSQVNSFPTLHQYSTYKSYEYLSVSQQRGSPDPLTVAFCFGVFCSIALFCSEEKGKLFVPSAQEKNTVVVSSKTGKLIDIDIQAVKNALPIFDVSLALV